MKKETQKRPNHRSVMLTVSRTEYEAIRALDRADKLPVYVVNDIIRTSRCGENAQHHWERRIVTVRAAVRGGWPYMKVRWSGGSKALRVEVSEITGEVDASFFRCLVQKMGV